MGFPPSGTLIPQPVGFPVRIRIFMMNPTDGWMGGGMWLWTVVGVLVVILLVVVINKQFKK